MGAAFPVPSTEAAAPADGVAGLWGALPAPRAQEQMWPCFQFRLVSLQGPGMLVLGTFVQLRAYVAGRGFDCLSALPQPGVPSHVTFLISPFSLRSHWFGQFSQKSHVHLSGASPFPFPWFH